MSKQSDGAGAAPESGFPETDPFERHQPERDLAKRGTRPPVGGEKEKKGAPPASGGAQPKSRVEG